jgi:hypothetical protein
MIQGLCAVGAALLAPLVFLGRKATRLQGAADHGE